MSLLCVRCIYMRNCKAVNLAIGLEKVLDRTAYVVANGRARLTGTALKNAET